jgi:hypothetical protein
MSAESLPNIKLHAEADFAGTLHQPVLLEHVIAAANEQGVAIQHADQLNFGVDCDKIDALGVYRLFDDAKPCANIWIVKKTKDITETDIDSVNIMLPHEVDGNGNFHRTQPSISSFFYAVHEKMSHDVKCPTSETHYVTPCGMIDTPLTYIDSLGVYKVVNRATGKFIKVWLLKWSDGRKHADELLHSGNGNDTHYFASSRNGSKVYKSRDEVRAFVTNEINLANIGEGGGYIEDIGYRCNALEQFFNRAKPGDHSVIRISNNRDHDITAIRLRNEIQ